MTAGNTEQLRQQRDGFVVDCLVLIAAMAVLYHGHTRALEIDELFAGTFERGQRQRRGAWIEVDHAHGESFPGKWTRYRRCLAPSPGFETARRSSSSSNVFGQSSLSSR